MVIRKLSSIVLWIAIGALAYQFWTARNHIPLDQLESLFQKYSQQSTVRPALGEPAAIAGIDPMLDMTLRLNRIEGSLHEAIVAVTNLQSRQAVAAWNDNDDTQEKPGEEVDDLFRQQLAESGISAEGLPPEILRPAIVDAGVAGFTLEQSFYTSDVSRYAQITSSACQQSSCNFEINFRDAQSAIEKESLLLSWLMTADPACSFHLDAPDPNSLHAISTNRKLRLDCQMGS